MKRGAFHALDGSREREMMMGAPPMLDLAQHIWISTPTIFLGLGQFAHFMTMAA